ncbi:extracellular solute-binding protein [Patescibacteria group bacterium]|nr:extracellular solute-binding protein [Patescibacteria group bacterium]
MNFSKQQLIIFGGIVVVIMLFVFILAGILPGSKNNATNPASINGTLNVWVYNEDPLSYSNIISAFNSTYPNVKIKIKPFTDYNVYKQSLLEAMATGGAPDVFMIPSTELPAYLNKIIPASQTTFTPLNVSQYFPGVVGQDFVSGGYVYGLPLSVDTLSLIYNKDLFAKAGVVFPPATWQDFLSDIPTLTSVSPSGDITQSAAAIGTSASNIDDAPDILSLLMLQTGTQITDKTSGTASFDSSTGINAINFYTEFADPKNKYYTWNSNMPDSLDAFAQNKVAMILDYESSLSAIKAKNNFLNYGVSPMPEPASSTVFVSYPKYFGYVVSRQSKMSSLAWTFIIDMTTVSQNADSYVKATGEPPALLTLINSYSGDPNLSVFVKQELYARSWYGPSRDQINQAFSNMIDAINSKKTDVGTAVRQAKDQVTSILANPL